jgi:hypothetical protein
MSPLFVGSGSSGSEGRSDRLGLPTGTTDPGTAEAGDLFYNTDTNKIRYYDGTQWLDLAAGGGGGGGGSGYTIANSLMLDDALTTKLTRTHGPNPSSTKFSCSFWFKQTKALENNVITSSGSGGCIRFMNAGSEGTSNDMFLSVKVAGTNVSTPRLFRDYTGWAHCLVVYDGTEGTAVNRLKIWINGESVEYTGGTASTTTSTLGGNNEHVIGAQQHNNNHGYDGYLAEFNWVDGEAKLPTDFGTVNTTTGQWDPIEYTGNYGNAGYYLKFSTSTYGTDYSTNGNTWSQSGFSLTPEIQHRPKDSPTHDGTATTTGGEVAGNYCTFDSNITRRMSTTAGWANNSDCTFDRGNLRVQIPTTEGTAVGTMVVTSGKWYFEGKWTTLSPSNDTSGFGLYDYRKFELNSGFNDYGDGFRGHRYRGTGPHYAYVGSASDQTINTASTGDWYGIAIDIDNNIFQIYRNGTLEISSTSAITAGKRWIPVVFGDGTATLEFNFGSRPWNYSPPSADYKPWCTAELPDPYYVDPRECFGQLIWTGTGTGGTRTITDTNAVQFAPDLVWSKSYEGSQYHNQMYDAVRGFVSKANGVGPLVTDETFAEGTPSGGYISNTGTGQIIYDQEGTGTGYEWYDQNNTHEYVARCWNAGGTNQTLTNGEISATVRANQNCGFSVVGWTGPNNTNDHDVPHGLSKAPEFIITKNRDTTFNWDIYHYRLTDAQSLVFTNAAPRTVSAFQNEDPTATTFPVFHNFTTNENEAYIAYCWHSVDGLSSFGQYVGNGVVDGPYYHCGFRPSLIIIKGAAGGSQWFVHDDARDPEVGDGNPSTKEMAWETTQVQYDTVSVGAGQRLDIYSNGFKIKTANGACNTDGLKYLVMAWARSPFKYARGR